MGSPNAVAQAPTIVSLPECDLLPAADEDWALFLDVDGTLLDIARTPLEVKIPADLPDLLGRLRDRLDGAVALVSGRTIADLDRLFAPLRLVAAGQHGGEVRSAGDGPILHPVSGVPLGEFNDAIASFASTCPGVIVECKGMSTAVHYRLVEQYRTPLRRFISDWLASRRTGLQFIEGRSVFEVKPPEVSKLTAVGYLSRHKPFAGRTPIFIGDDRTDEDGFAAVIALGGQAVHVGTGEASIANWRLADPEKVREWLRRVAAALECEKQT